MGFYDATVNTLCFKVKRKHLNSKGLTTFTKGAVDVHPAFQNNVNLVYHNFFKA